jgi:hypothetical protein
VIVILWQQLDYVIVDYGRADHAASDKSYVFLFQDSIIIYLSLHPTFGGSAMKNHLAYYWLRKIAKALVAGVPCRIFVNLVYSRMKLD